MKVLGSRSSQLHKHSSISASLTRIIPLFRLDEGAIGATHLGLSITASVTLAFFCGDLTTFLKIRSNNDSMAANRRLLTFICGPWGCQKPTWLSLIRPGSRCRSSCQTRGSDQLSEARWVFVEKSPVFDRRRLHLQLHAIYLHSSFPCWLVSLLIL